LLLFIKSIKVWLVQRNLFFITFVSESNFGLNKSYILLGISSDVSHLVSGVLEANNLLLVFFVLLGSLLLVHQSFRSIISLLLLGFLLLLLGSLGILDCQLLLFLFPLGFLFILSLFV